MRAVDDMLMKSYNERSQSEWTQFYDGASAGFMRSGRLRSENIIVS